MLSGPFDRQDIAVALSTGGGHRNAPLTAEVLTGHRLCTGHDLFHRTGTDHFPAVDAGAGADVDNVVCRPHGVFIVFHHNERVPQVPQLFQGRNELVVVLLLKTDAGLIEDVEDSGQSRTDLGGEPNALTFSAGQGPRAAGQVQVFEADALQELQPGFDLFQNEFRDDLIPLGKLEVLKELQFLLNGEMGQFIDVEAADGDRKALRLQTFSVAEFTVMFRHDLFDLSFGDLRTGLLVLALEVVDDPFEPGLPGPVGIGGPPVEFDPFSTRSVEDLFEVLPLHVFDGSVDGEAEVV